MRDAFQHEAYQYTLAGVLIDSSNAGISKFSERVSPQTRFEYLQKFGIGSGSAVGFEGESKGLLYPASQWDNQQLYNTSFGQGVTTTVPELMGAYDAIANGGVRMPLSLVESCTKADGTVITPDLPEPTQVISGQTSAEMREILENVAMQAGYAKQVEVPGYRICDQDRHRREVRRQRRLQGRRVLHHDDRVRARRGPAVPGRRDPGRAHYGNLVFGQRTGVPEGDDPGSEDLPRHAGDDGADAASEVRLSPADARAVPDPAGEPMISLTLAQLAHVLDGELHLAAGATVEDIVRGAVDTDSRLIEPGGIFVAKPGEVTDGHLFVDAAVANGAAVAIVERVVPAPVTQIVVADAIRALADLARHVVAVVRDAGSLRIVGITGSNGKTTTKNMLARILEDEGETVAPRASFNNEVGAPLTMLRVTADTRFLVSEFGASAPGEIARLAGLVEPDVGVVLMVGMAHAGGFGGIEATFQAKSELVRALRPGGVAVLNADDPRVAAMAPIAAEQGVSVRWFGRGSGADVRADDVEVTADGTRCTVSVKGAATADGTAAPLHLRVLGEHHVMNALAAIAAATTLGVSLEACVARLQTVEARGAVAHAAARLGPCADHQRRLQREPGLDVRRTADPRADHGTGERTVAVLGAMSELGEYADEEHDRVGLLAVRLGIQRIVVVGAPARRMYLEAIAQGSWDAEAIFFTTADEAYDYLMGELRDGDRVLVKSSNSAGLRFLGDRLGESFS